MQKIFFSKRYKWICGNGKKQKLFGNQSDVWHKLHNVHKISRITI